jgi:hypothetical protein
MRAIAGPDTGGARGRRRGASHRVVTPRRNLASLGKRFVRMTDCSRGRSMRMRLALIVLLLPLGLGACVSFSSSNPPPPRSTTVVVPPGSTVTY